MSTPLRVAIAGASGRMGRMLVEAVLAAPDLRLAAALEADGSAAIGQDAAAFAGQHSGVRIGSDVREALRGADVLIDFTRPEATLHNLHACRDLGVRAVVGTTGFSPAQRAEIETLASQMAVVLAPNMSVGVNVVFKLLEQAARALDSGYDIEIIEAHHRHKVDAPSGTALKMGEVVARALGRELQDCAVLARHGATGERSPGTIGFSAVRGGDIVGDHTVLFAGTGERIEITHRSTSRAGYAAGSLRAARFVAARSPGLYGMEDVLGL